MQHSAPEPRRLSGCATWCNQYTCSNVDCDACGSDVGCERAVNKAVKQCSNYCNQYTCEEEACTGCGPEQGCPGQAPPSPPSAPLWPPTHAGGLRLNPSEYWTYGSSIHTTAWGMHGDPSKLLIKGVAWFGLESQACHIGGSDQRSLESIAAWIKQHGFNAVRVPFAADALVQPHHACLKQGNLDGIKKHNPRLLGMSYAQRIQTIVKVAGDAGLVVLLDAHVTEAGKWPDGGTVNTAEGRQLLSRAWERLSDALCDPIHYWNVMGADLKNEPYGMFWGEPPVMGLSEFRVPPYAPEDRWDTLASTLGTLIHQHCPRWLSFVQGVGHCHSKSEGPCTLASAPNVQDTNDNHGIWWGENLLAAATSPVDVGETRVGVGKVVASPHTYGPSTNSQPQFNQTIHPTYPENLPPIWSKLWGFLASNGAMPVVVGEFGGRGKASPDRAFQGRLAAYLSQQSIGAFYWCLNPESADTGGLISDWKGMRPDNDKLSLISVMQGSFVPTAAERSKAKDLFSVSALPPPAVPLPPGRPPSPMPPSPSPPPKGSEYDFLFSEANGGGGAQLTANSAPTSSAAAVGAWPLPGSAHASSSSLHATLHREPKTATPGSESGSPQDGVRASAPHASVDRAVTPAPAAPGFETSTVLVVVAGLGALLVLLIAVIRRWQQPSRGSYTRAGKEDEHEQFELASGAVFLVDDDEEEVEESAPPPGEVMRI
jgi:endoglucanase